MPHQWWQLFLLLSFTSKNHSIFSELLNQIYFPAHWIFPLLSFCAFVSFDRFYGWTNTLLNRLFLSLIARIGAGWLWNFNWWRIWNEEMNVCGWKELRSFGITGDGWNVYWKLWDNKFSYFDILILLTSNLPKMVMRWRTAWIKQEVF